MPTDDIRWFQRFANYEKALASLREAVELAQLRPLSSLERLGLIHVYKFTHELAWNTMKDFLEDHGTSKMFGSKDATREAFKASLIEDGNTWMEMIKSRNKTSHTYNEPTANDIARWILEKYWAAFVVFQEKFSALREEALSK